MLYEIAGLEVQHQGVLPKRVTGPINPGRRSGALSRHIGVLVQVIVIREW
jgi:hypothetical protein